MITHPYLSRKLKTISYLCKSKMRFNIEYTNMYELTRKHYTEICEKLRDKIGGSNFFSGEVESFFEDGAIWKLNLTCFISNGNLCEVWWTFSVGSDFDTYDNNFLFSKVKDIWQSKTV